MQAARVACGDRAIYINVQEDPEKFEEMLTYSGGKMEVPVIVDGDKVAVGFSDDLSLRGASLFLEGT